MGSDINEERHKIAAIISIHAPRMGSDRLRFLMRTAPLVFQSTLPAWGATPIIIPCSTKDLVFQSTLPAWGATRIWVNSQFLTKFQSTLPAWGATYCVGCRSARLNISIHAPRMGSDSTAKAYSNDRIKWSTLREPHFLYSKNACFSPIVSMCAATSRTKKSENQSFIRIISRLGAYVLHLRLVSVPQIIEPYAVRLLVHQHFQCGTK